MSLNTLLQSLKKLDTPFIDELLLLRKADDHPPLPEDYLIRGQLWSQWYFPSGWFNASEETIVEPSEEIAADELWFRRLHKVMTMEAYKRPQKSLGLVKPLAMKIHF